MLDAGVSKSVSRYDLSYTRCVLKDHRGLHNNGPQSLERQCISHIRQLKKVPPFQRRDKSLGRQWEGMSYDTTLPVPLIGQRKNPLYFVEFDVVSDFSCWTRLTDVQKERLKNITLWLDITTAG